MEEKKPDIELRSDEVQEILSRTPNWMIRWGISLIVALILVVLFLSWFIKYPDVVSGKVSLTTAKPPSHLISQTSGYLESILVKEDAKLTKGEIIAEIRSPISKKSIEKLDFILKEKDKAITIIELQKLHEVGTLQREVNDLLNNLIEYQELVTNSYYEQSIENLKSQMRHNRQLATITAKELKLLKRELVNAKEKFEADSLLYEKQVIAKHTFYNNQSEYVAKKKELINAEKNYVQYKIASADYEKQYIGVEQSFNDQKRRLKSACAAARRNIEAAILNWQQTFVLIAPLSGKLAYLNNWSEQDYVTLGQEMFAIIPENEDIVGVVRISEKSYGKVEVGQKVRMKLDNYPYQEFGQLIGTVVEVSEIPSEEGYYVKVSLKEGLLSTYKKTIEYKPEMKGSAEIVTEDLRLIERVFNSFRQLLDE